MYVCDDLKHRKWPDEQDGWFHCPNKHKMFEVEGLRGGNRISVFSNDKQVFEKSTVKYPTTITLVTR